MNIRQAAFMINPDRRFAPEPLRCGYVEVFAVAPGCFPVSVGSLSTCLWRGQIRYLGPSGRRVSLVEALEELRSAHLGNWEMQPMSDEILAAIAAAPTQE